MALDGGTVYQWKAADPGRGGVMDWDFQRRCSKNPPCGVPAYPWVSRPVNSTKAPERLLDPKTAARRERAEVRARRFTGAELYDFLPARTRALRETCPLPLITGLPTLTRKN
jgi:hypothetical protein